MRLKRLDRPPILAAVVRRIGEGLEQAQTHMGVILKAEGLLGTDVNRA